jgi:hypothetical protein
LLQVLACEALAVGFPLPSVTQVTLPKTFYLVEMKIPQIIFVVIAAFLITACTATKKTTTSRTKATISETVRDGSSFEKAIIVKSVKQEYAWVEKHYPNSQRQMQQLVDHENKPFDVLTFTLQDGSTKRFYFDISKFFGKF